MAKLENKLRNKIKIGILGGTFDPPHKGHLAISKKALEKFKLKTVIWAITNKNPFKKESKNNLKKRIYFCKKIIGKSKKIKIKFFENIVKSNKTSDLIDFFYKEKKYELFF